MVHIKPSRTVNFRSDVNGRTKFMQTYNSKSKVLEQCAWTPVLSHGSRITLTR